MNSLRSRTRISDTHSQNPTPLDSPKAHKQKVFAPQWRGFWAVFTATMLVCVLLVVQLHRDESAPSPRIVERQPRRAVPTIYRDFLSPAPKKSSSQWPPRVTRIPTSSKKYLIAGYIGEQESKARMHVMDILELARQLDRILVLPNVGQSRLGMCRDHAFETYYDATNLDGSMPMDDFARLADDGDRLTAQLVVVGTNVKVSVPDCVPNFNLSPSSSYADAHNVSDVLAALHISDVLIVNWNLRYPRSAARLSYAPALETLANTLAPSEPYVMVHWRMETVPASAMISCAHSLVDAINAAGIKVVWLATDYPLSLRKNSGIVMPKSSTFRDWGKDHRHALDILLKDSRVIVKDLESGLGDAYAGTDMGILGILDKLVGIRADMFMSGAKGCGRQSSFTRQIVDGRKVAWSTRRYMLNVVDYFGKEHRLN